MSKTVKSIVLKCQKRSNEKFREQQWEMSKNVMQNQKTSKKIHMECQKTSKRFNIQGKSYWDQKKSINVKKCQSSFLEKSKYVIWCFFYFDHKFIKFHDPFWQILTFTHNLVWHFLTLLLNEKMVYCLFWRSLTFTDNLLWHFFTSVDIFWHQCITKHSG